jgi:8-oxo-dGTP diphosphatase
MEEIRLVNLSETSLDAFQKHLADVVILTSQNKLLLQHRPLTWQTSPGRVNLFGGHVEFGEQPIEAAAREINEETGGILSPDDLLFIGTITEGWTNHTEAVHVYFWHDKNCSITGCYEAESIEFDTAADAMKHPKIMDYTQWALNECARRGLLPS